MGILEFQYKSAWHDQNLTALILVVYNRYTNSQIEVQLTKVIEVSKDLFLCRMQSKKEKHSMNMFFKYALVLATMIVGATAAHAGSSGGLSIAAVGNASGMPYTK